MRAVTLGDLLFASKSQKWGGKPWRKVMALPTYSLSDHFLWLLCKQKKKSLRAKFSTFNIDESLRNNYMSFNIRVFGWKQQYTEVRLRHPTCKYWVYLTKIDFLFFYFFPIISNFHSTSYDYALHFFTIHLEPFNLT